MGAEITKEVALDLYETMLRIRKFEEAVGELFGRGRLPGFVHTSIGQEAIAAGVCSHLSEEDVIISTHRGHGHLIAKGGRFDLMMAELFGKRSGYNKGKGGSMHIADPSIGMLGANAIVGAGLVLINGSALTAQYSGTNNVAVCFFGDGASNTGAFHEALNLASVWDLPSIFVCENNRYAESTPQVQHQNIEDIAVRGRAYGIPSITVDGDDVGAIYKSMEEAVTRARGGNGPTLLEAKTHRWSGHHEADPQDYRPAQELANLEEHCPLEHWREVLRGMGVDRETTASIERGIEKELEDAIRFGEESPLPEPSDAFADIFTPVEERT